MAKCEVYFGDTWQKNLKKYQEELYRTIILGIIYSLLLSKFGSDSFTQVDACQFTSVATDGVDGSLDGYGLLLPTVPC